MSSDAPGSLPLWQKAAMAVGGFAVLVFVGAFVASEASLVAEPVIRLAHGAL